MSRSTYSKAEYSAINKSALEKKNKKILKYQKSARKFMRKDSKENIIRELALGIVGESIELFDIYQSLWNGQDSWSGHLYHENERLFCRANIKNDLINESGDVMWYCVALAEMLNISIDITQKLHGISIVIAAKEISEHIKKAFRDGVDIDSDYVKTYIDTIISLINVMPYSTLEKIMSRNIKKLKDRYGEAFNAAGSINRKDN